VVVLVRGEYAAMGPATIVTLGRCVVAPIVSGRGANVAIASAYMIADSAMEGQNLELAAEIAQGVGTCGLPTIVGGDWQSPPSEVHAAGVDRLMATTVVAPCGQGVYVHHAERWLVYRLLLGV
jgi:hypothetical protein